MEYLTLPMRYGIVETVGGDCMAGELQFTAAAGPLGAAVIVSAPASPDCAAFARVFPLGRIHSITPTTEDEAAHWAGELAAAGSARPVPPSMLFATGGELLPPTAPGSHGDEFPF